jgi:hypothetical protein
MVDDADDCAVDEPDDDVLADPDDVAREVVEPGRRWSYPPDAAGFGVLVAALAALGQPESFFVSYSPKSAYAPATRPVEPTTTLCRVGVVAR